MKTVLITGGSSKIAQACIIKFLDNNYQVITTEHSKKIDIPGIKSYFLDIKSLDSIKELVNSIKKDYGKIDVLINNIGTCCDKDLDEKSVDEFRNIIDTNLVEVSLLQKIEEIKNE